MICIKTFANLFEAEVAGRTLEAHGLEVRLSTDDGRDMTSGFGGVQLFVEDDDAERAVAILTAPEAGSAAGVDEEASVEPPRRPGRRIISGVLWTCGGVVVTVGTYKLTAPTGTFFIASGAVAYGLYELGRGIVEALSTAEVRETDSVAHAEAVGSSSPTAWLFPSEHDSTRPVDLFRMSKLLREAYALAELETLKGGLWHPWRRKWATERKNMPLRDVAEAGGWRDPNTLLKCYMQPDEATMTRVVLEPGKLREA